MRCSDVPGGLRIGCTHAGVRGQNGRRGTANGSGRRSRSRRWRFGAVAMAAGLAAVTLIGCGSAGSSGSPAVVAPTKTAKLSGQTLTVYTQAPYGTQLKEYEQYYAYIATQFHKATGSTVKWVYSSSAVSLSQELEQAAATGGGPDVWSIGSSFNGTASALNEFYMIQPRDWARSAASRSSFRSSSPCPGRTTAGCRGPVRVDPVRAGLQHRTVRQAGIQAARRPGRSSSRTPRRSRRRTRASAAPVSRPLTRTARGSRCGRTWSRTAATS